MLFYGLLIKVARIFENHTNVREGSGSVNLFTFWMAS